MMWLAVLLLIGASLWAWFIAMAETLTGPVGALIATAGPLVVGLLLYKELRK